VGSLVEDAHDKTTARLGLEPGALRGHVEAGIGHVQQLLDAHRVHAEGSQAVFLTAFDEALETATAPNKIDCGACAHVLDTKDVSQDAIVENLDIESAYFTISTVLLNGTLDRFRLDDALVPSAIDK